MILLTTAWYQHSRISQRMEAEVNAMVLAKVWGSRIRTHPCHQRALGCMVRANAAHALFSGSRRDASLELSANIAICALRTNKNAGRKSKPTLCAQQVYPKQKEVMLRVFL